MKSRSAWQRRLEAALGIASSAILLVLMLLTVVDVVARYLFDAPLKGAFEITELMLLVLIFAGLPLVSNADEHVTMDFIDRMVPRFVLRALVRLVHLVSAGALLLLAWLTWIKAGRLGEYGDTTEVLNILISPFVYFMAVAIAATGLIHAIKIVYPGAAKAAQGAN
ncbi:MAG: TRAP transporter small permease [Rhodospirillaceae bacterium]|nr:TRAP transporter small permease [Rhodospirillaceae bacterium]